MTLDQLRIFAAVAEREHVTQAAAFLNLTQSAVSAAISALEERHAVRLFDRVGRRIVLTDAGRSFLVEARAMLGRAEQAERLLADLAGLKRGTLRLAASQTVANYWLPPIMHRFHCTYPGFELQLSIGNTAEVAQMVHEASADLGFVEGDIEDASLSIHPLPGDQLSLVVAPGHPWVAQPPVTALDLAASPWVLREPGSGTRMVSEAVLLAHGLTIGDIQVALELPSNESVRAAVEAGAGATLISELVVTPSVETGRLARIALDLPRRDFHVLHHKERQLSLAERRFLEMAETPGDKHAGSASAQHR
ncbi:LysR family transcriptional regulator [Paracoccus sp. CPCC 101403]|uniref:LysR family transcriptional regulator n=1 Tax=Paracoccus broussonetiae TaxID=3075834 RepID=A0ABU3EE17_9RHOB|nr:LysR family transcriptional regulator [Paracoccus sp. CPCC 101403]MDT1062478.1 LysR family transcriptional regulator [Paracoccus sp. CPCC 101403]